MANIAVADKVKEVYPSYRAIAVIAEGLELGVDSRPKSLALLRQAEESVRTKFDYLTASEHPHISAWRQVYGSFGVKPSRVLCGAEALLKRVLNGHELPDIGTLVNVYNAVSIKTSIPIGGENLNAILGNATLKFSDGTEPFEYVDQGELKVEFPEVSEPIWADSLGCTCRRWNWRQCARTALHDNVVAAYFVIDVVAPYEETQLLEAANLLEQSLAEVFPTAHMTQLKLV